MPSPPAAFFDAVASAFPVDFLTREGADLIEFGRDWTRVVEPAPCAVALPRSTDEVARLVKLCGAHHVPIVPSGGRTGLAAGAVAAHGEVVISLSRMRAMHPVDVVGGTVRVQAGAVTQAVHEHCEAQGLTWPVDFASKGSSTVGTLVNLRYIGKPMVGFEFNYDHSRFTEDTSNYTSCPNAACNYILGGAQTGANELTLGYVAHPHKLFGIPTYLGAGGGTLRFKPTPYGGQGLPQQYRAVYYYEGGLEDNFPDSHFGVRLGFRQLIYLAPDFGQNYLTITRRTLTSEPTIGFFVRF